MNYQWFVLHALSGQEFKIQANMEKRLQIEEVEEYINQILIPTEKVSEVRDGKKYEITRKFYPGYVMIHMALYDEDGNLNEKAWHFTQSTPGVIGFADGDTPAPLTDLEVEQMINQVQEKAERVTPKIDFELGETIKINDGPFMNFNGDVEEIDPEHGKLKVSVSIFGRATPVELEYWQVEKV